MNSAGFDKLYEACYMRVFSYAMTMAGDRHLAEEITQVSPPSYPVGK